MCLQSTQHLGAELPDLGAELWVLPAVSLSLPLTWAPSLSEELCGGSRSEQEHLAQGLE